MYLLHSAKYLRIIPENNERRTVNRNEPVLFDGINRYCYFVNV